MRIGHQRGPLHRLVSHSALPLLAPFSSSAPLLALTCSDPPWISSSPAQPRCVDSCVPPQTSRPVVPTRPVEQSTPPWLLPPTAPPGTVLYSALPCFLVPPDPPWSDIVLPEPPNFEPFAALRLATPSAPPSLQFHQGPRSHSLRLDPPTPRLHLGSLSLWLRTALQDLSCHPVPSVSWLHLCLQTSRLHRWSSDHLLCLGSSHH